MVSRRKRLYDAIPNCPMNPEQKLVGAILGVPGRGWKSLLIDLYIENCHEPLEAYAKWAAGLLEEHLRMETEALREPLGVVLATLSPRERKVLDRRFGLTDGQSRTLSEVAPEFCVTRERIRQIEAVALRKLRHPSRSRSLPGYHWFQDQIWKKFAADESAAPVLWLLWSEDHLRGLRLEKELWKLKAGSEGRDVDLECPVCHKSLKMRVSYRWKLKSKS